MDLKEKKNPLGTLIKRPILYKVKIIAMKLPQQWFVGGKKYEQQHIHETQVREELHA